MQGAPLNSMKHGIYWVCGLFSMVSLASSHRDETVLLENHAVVGEIHRYRQVAKLNFKGNDIDYVSTSTRRTVRVESDHSFAVNEEQAEVKLNGLDAPKSATGDATTIIYAANGEVKKIEGANVPASLYRVANLNAIVLPVKPVQVGDHWNWESKPDTSTSSIFVKGTFSLVKEEKIGVLDTFQIGFSLKEEDADGASSDGTVWLLKKDMSIVKLTAKWINMPLSSDVISGETSLTLIL